MVWAALYHQYVYITTSLQECPLFRQSLRRGLALVIWASQRYWRHACWTWPSLFFFGLRLDFLLCWICSFVIGVEDVHVGQSLPGSQRENSWPGLHILGKTQSKLVIAPAEQIFMKKATTKKFFQIVYPQHANKLYFERELKLNECLRLVLADQVTAWLVFLSTPQ